MLVIAVLNTKGGVGKTTLTAALAVKAAETMRVGVLDLDPQASLSDWFNRGPCRDKLAIIDGEERASEAVAALDGSDQFDLMLIDGPPGSMLVTEDAIKTADLVVVPLRASSIDLIATQDCLRLCQRHKVRFVCVLSDVNARDTRSLGENARKALRAGGITVAGTIIAHRVQHVNAMTSGRTAAETDRAAAAEIAALWTEVLMAERPQTKGARHAR